MFVSRVCLIQNSRFISNYRRVLIIKHIHIYRNKIFLLYIILAPWVRSSTSRSPDLQNHLILLFSWCQKNMKSNSARYTPGAPTTMPGNNTSSEKSYIVMGFKRNVHGPYSVLFREGWSYAHLQLLQLCFENHLTTDRMAAAARSC